MAVNVKLPDAYKGRGQTFIKHLFLRNYLDRVAYNILSTREEFVYVDGFSGPWMSRDEKYGDTPFGIAMANLRNVKNSLIARGKLRTIRCLFIEKDPTKFEKLDQVISNVSDMEVRALKGEFENCIQKVLEFIGASFSLIFIDPTGWNIDLQKMAPALRHRPGEVIVNFMYDDINRHLTDERPGIQASYVPPFGDPSWRQKLNAKLSQGMPREEAITELFRDCLKSIGQFEYVLSSPVQYSTADRSQFYLFYGTRHPKGLVEFRRVERIALQTQDLVRIEEKHAKIVERTKQPSLFNPGDLEQPAATESFRESQRDLAYDRIKHLLGRLERVPYEDVRTDILERFVISETELGKLLRDAKKADELDIEGLSGRAVTPRPGCVIVRKLVGDLGK